MMRLVQEERHHPREVSGDGTTRQPAEGSVTFLEERKRAATGGTEYSWVEDYIERLEDREEFREFCARMPLAVG